jgi:hypothetical protein
MAGTMRPLINSVEDLASQVAVASARLLGSSATQVTEAANARRLLEEVASQVAMANAERTGSPAVLKHLTRQVEKAIDAQELLEALAARATERTSPSDLLEDTRARMLMAANTRRAMQDLAAQLSAFSTAFPRDELNHLNHLVGSSPSSIPETAIVLTRDQKRLLFAYYVYCVVLSLILVTVLKVMSRSENDNEILGLTSILTGLSGHKLATVARDAAWQVFDRMSPPDDNDHHA